MGMFDDLIQRGLDEAARRKMKADEERARMENENKEEILDGDYKPVSERESEDVKRESEDTVSENPSVTENSDEMMAEHSFSDDISDEKQETVVQEHPSAEVEELVIDSESDISNSVRQDCVSGDLKFPEDMPENQREDIRALMAMPETNLDEVSAKAVELLALHRGESRPWMSPGSGSVSQDINVWESYLALEKFHQMYDSDDGVQWKQNEQDHPLDGWSHPDTIVESPDVVTVDMTKYGYPDKLQTESVVEKDATSEKESSEIPKVKSTALVLAEPEHQDGYSELYAGTRELKDNGMIAYDGYLGKFEYDPSEFELQVVRVQPDEFGNGGGTYPVLKYIGNEVDGKYIHIPEGLTSGALMFADNPDLQTMPKLPDSLEDGFAMFKGCTNMQYANALVLPSHLQEADFMFADCVNMTHGPSMLPSSLKDATGMFYNCQSMENTPRLNSGLEVADSMFADCKSLTKKPRIPHSVQQADGATYGCVGIDKAEQMKVDKQQAKAEKKVEKQMNRKTFGDRIGSLFSACMQVHACRRNGCNMIYAMFQTHMMRKNGQWGKDMTAGWSALYRQNKSNFNGLMMNIARQNAQKRRQRDYERGQKDYDAVTSTSFLGKAGSKQDRMMYSSGKRAVDSGYFERVAKSGYPGYKTLQTALRDDLDSMSKTMAYRKDAGTMNTNAKTYYAKQIQELVSNQTAYYRGAEKECERKAADKNTGKSFDKTTAMMGASTVVNSNMNLLANRILDMQSEHQFLNNHQARTICAMMAGTSFGKTDEFKQFQDKLQDSIVQQDAVHVSRTDDMMRDRVNRASQVKDRGRQAESAFSFASDTSSPEDDMSLGM